MNKIIITKWGTTEEFYFTGLWNDKEFLEMNFEKNTDDKTLNSIYVGKVRKIVSNINAAFIEIAPHVECYYSLESNTDPIYTNKMAKSPSLAVGDELLVQITKEAIKTKAPQVSSNLNLAGKYLALTTEKKKLGISNKIDKEKKSQLKEVFLPLLEDSFGIVIRTKATLVPLDVVLEEYHRLRENLLNIINRSKHLTCFSCVHKGYPSYLSNIRDIQFDQLSEIITDNADVFSNIKEYLATESPEQVEKLTFYQDNYPMNKLFRLDYFIEGAMMERVWLDSGGYIIIQPTEALVSIDVNTGKFTGHKKIQETFLKINLEAAKEIAKQLRLRNLSGIILVDFIDLDLEKDRAHLLDTFEKYLKVDSVQTNLIDMTKLNLVEVTRKKIRKSLREQIAVTCSVCDGKGITY